MHRFSRFVPGATAAPHHGRRLTLQRLVAALGSSLLHPLSHAATMPATAGSGTQTLIGAAWRGPKLGDRNFAGTLLADWEARTVRFGWKRPLPSRPHGLVATAGGGLLLCAARPGSWLLHCDADGRVIQQLDLDTESGHCRLGGHAVISADGELVFTTETDFSTGRGRIGVRELRSLRKLAETNSFGIEPHQLLLDQDGKLLVANGGIPRDGSDRKIDLDRMDSSLARIDPATGELLGHWRVDDPRLSLRHLAWNHAPQESGALLGIAMNAEHDLESTRRKAPILAVFDGDTLSIPTHENDGIGYAGDIAPALHHGFALSSHQADLAQLWHPGMHERLRPIVELKAPYAITGWHGPADGGGVLVATAFGVGRWHPKAAPDLLPWPEPMALDNHWILLAES